MTRSTRGLRPPDDLLDRVWADYGDSRRIVAITEVSANVSTNRVYRLSLDGRGDEVYAKVSSYGSYFLFVEDHDRIHRCIEELRSTRFDGMLADILTRDQRIYTWYDQRQWVVLYQGVERRRTLGRILSEGEIERLACEIAEFHLACSDLAPRLPLTSKSIKSDAIHLLDLLESPFAPRNFQLPPEHIGVLRRHTHDFLVRLDEMHYDYWAKIPVLIDWNLGNFSVTGAGDDFRLFSRWDYDWFRIEPRMLDFYFLSRVSSRTGDRTQFTYASHTLTEPRFQTFIRAYHQVMPLSADDIRFLPEVYRFFILNYVVREGARFFRPDYCATFRHHAVTRYLPELERLDITPLLEIVGP